MAAAQPGISKELAEHLMVPYASGERPLITLYMDVIAPAHGGPWPAVLVFHGWHQNLTHAREKARYLAARGFCALNLNLRGRCDTVGEPDANGWELRDAFDALRFARHGFPQLCAQTLPPRAFGASGGGGNVYALIGKCPDLLSAAVVFCGVSDYAAWYEGDKAGEFRDEMDVWIGRGTKLHEEAYRARAGLTVAPNRACPLCVFHGAKDDRVPVEHARRYAAAQKKDARKSRDLPFFQYHELPGAGHDIPNEPHLAKAVDFLRRHDEPVYVPPRGRWVVAGFLKTHFFEVRWDHVGLVGHLDLDQRRRRLHLDCPSSNAAQVRLAGSIKHPELQAPVPRGCRVLSQRQEAGWTILDLQLHGQPVAVRWKA